MNAAPYAAPSVRASALFVSTTLSKICSSVWIASPSSAIDIDRIASAAATAAASAAPPPAPPAPPPRRRVCSRTQSARRWIAALSTLASAAALGWTKCAGKISGIPILRASSHARVVPAMASIVIPRTSTVSSCCTALRSMGNACARRALARAASRPASASVSQYCVPSVNAMSILGTMDTETARISSECLNAIKGSTTSPIT